MVDATGTTMALGEMMKGVSHQMSELQALSMLNCQLRGHHRLLATVDVRIEEPATMQTIRDLSSRVAEIEATLAAFRESIESQKPCIEQAQELKHRIDAQAMRAKGMRDTMPESLVEKANQLKGQVQQAPVQRAQTEDGADSGDADTVQDDAEEPPRKRPKRGVVQIPEVDSADIRSVPQYMRGRLTAKKMNACIAEINDFIATKYELIRKPLNKMDYNTKRRAKDVMSREISGLKAVVHFNENDSKEFKELQGSSGKTLLSVLRHMGYLKESKQSGASGLKYWELLEA